MTKTYHVKAQLSYSHGEPQATEVVITCDVIVTMGVTYRLLRVLYPNVLHIIITQVTKV